MDDIYDDITTAKQERVTWDEAVAVAKQFIIMSGVAVIKEVA